MTVTYQDQNGRKINGRRRWDTDVLRDGQSFGTISYVVGGYQFVPAGKRKATLAHPSLERLKEYIEEAAQ